MGFEQGHKKVGGRKAGVPNRKTRAIQERLELGCDPLEGMVKIIQDESTDVAVRAKILIELGRYVYPKVRPVEIQPDSDEPVERIEIVIATPENMKDYNEGREKPDFRPA